MSTVLEVSYFNSFTLKKVSGSQINVGSDGKNATWPGLPWNPTGYPNFPVFADPIAQKDLCWYVEEARIEGGFNNAMTELGPRAFITEQEDDEEVLRASIIFSGIFNSTTGINQTNVFSVGENITKNVDPRYGSIQKLYASDTNLDVFQENKISRALIDKDALYTAEGSQSVTSTNLVIGQITPYVGDFGISKSPESFAYFGFRRYLADPYRNKILRLSRDGITPISDYGMQDYFRDKLATVNNEWKIFKVITSSGTAAGSTSTVVVTQANGLNLEMGMGISSVVDQNGIGYGQGFPAIISNIQLQTPVATQATITLSENITIPSSNPQKTAITFFKYVKDKIVGGYDNYNDVYTLSVQPAVSNIAATDNYETLTYDEQVKGWTSFYTYKPNFIGSLKSDFYSFKDYKLYKHYDQTIINRNTFYGVQSDSSITFVFNSNPSIVKNFYTVNYEGTSGWEISSFKSDFTGFDTLNASYIQNQDITNSVKSYEEGLYTDSLTQQPARAGFDRKENLYVANLVNNTPVSAGEIIFGNQISGIKGYLSEVTIKTDSTTDYGGTKELFAVGTKFTKSS